MAQFILDDSDNSFPSVGDDISGSDSIYGEGGADSIRGGGGDDRIFGGTGRDTLNGEAGNDTINAGLLPVQEVLSGGSGTDLAIIDYEFVINTATNLSVRVVAEVSGGSWSTLIDGSLGVTVDGFERFEIRSGRADDRIIGGTGADTIASLGGSDRLWGGGGDDVISKTSGTYDLRGGDGTDRLEVTSTNERDRTKALFFDARADIGTLTSGTGTKGTFREFESYSVGGTEHGDEVRLGNGADLGNGAGGSDSLYGYGGNDRLDGGTGADQIYGGNGHDAIASGIPQAGTALAADTIYGGAGNDVITIDTPFGEGLTLTFAGQRLDGGSGNDRLVIESALAKIDLRGAAISGIETLDYATSFTGGLLLTAAQFNGFANFATNGPVTILSAGALVGDGDWQIATLHLFAGGQSLDMTGVSRTGTLFNINVIGGVGQDKVTGGALRDAISGGSGDDQLYGRDEADRLAGDGGNDDLYGGNGGDQINGGLGTDNLTGGRDADTFVFRTIADSGVSRTARDQILDFALNPAAGAAFVDRIDLSLIDAQAGVDGNQAFTLIGAAPYSGEGHIRALQQGNDTLLTMNTTGASGSEMTILLRNVMAANLTEADFLL